MYKHTLKLFVGIHNNSRLTCTWPHRKEKKIKEVQEALHTFATPKKTKPAWYGCASLDVDVLTSPMTSADYNIRIILALRSVFFMIKIQSFYVTCKHTLKHFVEVRMLASYSFGLQYTRMPNLNKANTVFMWWLDVQCLRSMVYSNILLFHFIILWLW
jgi:hypothetical protein